MIQAEVPDAKLFNFMTLNPHVFLAGFENRGRFPSANYRGFDFDHAPCDSQRPQVELLQEGEIAVTGPAVGNVRRRYGHRCLWFWRRKAHPTTGTTGGKTLPDLFFRAS